MKKINLKKSAGLLLTTVVIVSMLGGCSKSQNQEEHEENTLTDNVIITETGEVIDKEEDISEATQDPTSSPEIVTIDPELLVEPEQEQVITEEEEMYQGDKLQIVFLGDSIFDTYRDGTGIPYRTAVQCEANFYNLAIGGTTAAVPRDEQIGWEEWSSRSLVGVVNAIADHIPTDIFVNDAAKKILDDPDVDFTQTDYFVVEYGMNDFLSAVPLTSDSSEGDVKSYVGALRYAVATLKGISSDATIILCSPTYAQFYNGNWMIGDGNSVNNGYGTLFDYKGSCEYVANEQQVLFFNAYQDLGINGYTAEEYLEDGIHLTDKGRQLYADTLSRVILNYEETKNN